MSRKKELGVSYLWCFIFSSVMGVWVSSLGTIMSWLMVVRSGFYNFDGLVSSRMSFGFIS